MFLPDDVGIKPHSIIQAFDFRGAAVMQMMYGLYGTVTGFAIFGFFSTRNYLIVVIEAVTLLLQSQSNYLELHLIPLSSKHLLHEVHSTSCAPSMNFMTRSGSLISGLLSDTISV